ncbi:MAG: biotin--[acetyl-CoA-carboxylase] ligase [Clostridiales bacterium]|nr:biotin--[acetyl-CoA-carboxylase] ligase [Clostridiales bacterium]
MVKILEIVPSTNDYIKENMDSMSHGDCVLALTQTGGKGRLGRVWESRRGESLCFSMLIDVNKWEELTIIPLLCGLASLDTIGVGGLKWPNDIIIGDKKVGGILCECRGKRAVCGIGINLSQKEDFFRELPNGASLDMMGIPHYEAGVMAIRLRDNMLKYLNILNLDGKSGIISRFRSRCITLGCEVEATGSGTVIRGIASDINEDGELIIDTGSGLVPVNSGEVRLRTKRGYM